MGNEAIRFAYQGVNYNTTQQVPSLIPLKVGLSKVSFSMGQFVHTHVFESNKSVFYYLIKCWIYLQSYFSFNKYIIHCMLKLKSNLQTTGELEKIHRIDEFGVGNTFYLLIQLATI